MKTAIAKLYELVGINQLQKKNYKEAIFSFTEVIKLESQNASIYMRRAAAFVESNKIEAAIKDYTKAIYLNADLLDAYTLRGQLYLHKGLEENAISDFNEVIQKKPKQIDVFLLRALAYEKTKSNAEALADYKAVLKLNSKNQVARHGIARIQNTKIALTKLIQIELSRVGCDPGKIDGRWGVKGQSALKRYIKHSGNDRLKYNVPSYELVLLIQKSKDIVCIKKDPIFTGTWNCKDGPGKISITKNLYDDQALIIGYSREGNSYTLHLKDAKLVLSEVIDSSMYWYSPASGDGFHCTKLN